MRANTNPLSTMGYDNGRTQESRYGYGAFQGGGETMPFAGRRIKLWQHGGYPFGAATHLRPYMLHQGPFQMGGDVGGMDMMDQWDLEDAQDAATAQPAPTPVRTAAPVQEPLELPDRMDKWDDQDYNNALQVAMEDNPYLW
jgi:hypothetical protein